MISCAHDLIEEMLGDIQPDDRQPIFYRVACVKMAAPRHDRFEFYVGMGSAHIDRIFTGETFGSDVLSFIFPERFMSVHEQQAMISTLQKHPDAKKLERVDIVTSSPLIIGNFYRENIRICEWDDDEKHNGRPQYE